MTQKKFQINFSDIDPVVVNIGELIFKNILEFKNLLSYYLEFLNALSMEESKEFDQDILINFLQEFYELKNIDNQSTTKKYGSDNFQVLAHFLFINTIFTLLKREKYDYLSEIFLSDYWIKEKYQNEAHFKFDIFYHYSEFLDGFIKERDGQNYYSGTAHFLIHEFLDESRDKELFIDADLLCFYVSEVSSLRWFPITYVYKESKWNIRFLSRLKSKKYFDKFVQIFGVETILEFKQKVIASEENAKSGYSNYRGYSAGFETIPMISRIISLDEVCSLR